MARAKSAVLSAADKKAVITGIRADLKASKDALKLVLAGEKTAVKAFEAERKSVAAVEKAAVKAFNAVSQGFTKERLAHGKSVAKLEAELAAILGPK